MAGPGLDIIADFFQASFRITPGMCAAEKNITRHRFLSRWLNFIQHQPALAGPYRRKLLDRAFLAGVNVGIWDNTGN
jgi:hypothetical protein